jgi:hypothetical protein
MLLDAATGVPVVSPPWPPQLAACGADPGGEGTGGVRGVAAGDGDLIFVACRDANAVYVISRNNGSLLMLISAVRAPIGLLWGNAAGRPGLFIGGDGSLPRASGGGSAARGVTWVGFWDMAEQRLTLRYAHDDGGGHAAGIARLGGALLVLGQEAGELHQFDAASGAYVATLARGLHRPEWLIPWSGGCH